MNTKEALEIFDGLEPVDAAFMLGAWQGEGFATGHPLDGVLEIYHWQGKRFEDAETVHPLVFHSLWGGLTSVHPLWMLPVFGLLDKPPALARWPLWGRIFQFLLPLCSTRKGRARLRMTEYRGKLSATMVYDHLPINDVFRKMDANTVLGAMDKKGATAPFFFVLRRSR